MASTRSSMDLGAKLDEKPDDESPASGAASGQIPLDSEDLEKGTGAVRTPPVISEERDDAFLVKWEENDPEFPRNWRPWYKACLTLQLGMLALCGSLGSSIIAPAESAISEEFGVSREATVLCVALYVLGFALGPCLWAPVSEVYGRKVSILPPVLVLALFSIGSAQSRSAASLFVTRFFAGVFGSAPISNVSAALGDLYEPAARGIAVTFYAVCVCGGPTIGPVIGSALTVTKGLGWRWTEYIEAMWVGLNFIVALITMPEVFHAVILKRRAARLRKETGDERYWHPQESQKINLSNIVTKYLARPLKMLVTEPMITCIAIYASFVYGLLYMTLEIFPIVYVEERHWGLVLSTLPFLGVLVGVIAAMGLNIANQPYYIRAVAANKGQAVPEARLPPMAAGGWLFVSGLFWFGWTARPDIHWAVPTVATVFIGAGFNTIFQQCINYLVDTYGPYAASAVAANTILRSLMACGLPLAAKPMFNSLGVGPGASVLGAVAAVALPVPFLFKRYGLRLRKLSKFAPVKDD